MYLCVVSRSDRPLFEAALGPGEKPRDVDQFLAHAALDMAEEKAKLSNSMVLKEVDQFNDTKVSALCTANNAKIVLLHGAQLEEQNIRHFLMEVYELYLKAMLNPFFVETGPIQCHGFEEHVMAAAKRHLMR